MFRGKCDRDPLHYCRAVFAAIAFVGFTVAESQVNEVPFVWSPEYEVAVVYITFVWSESEKTGLSAVVAKNGFLNYCARFKSRLADFAKYLRNDADAAKPFKNAVAAWSRAVDELSRNDWNGVSGASDLESVGTQFRTAYKHLVINGGEIYGLPGIGEKERREVDGFTRGMAGTMIEILKGISNQLRNVPASV